MRPRLVAGWVVIDHDGPDVATIHIAVGEADDWKAAFRDFGENGQRIVQVRPPADLTGQVLVWLRVDGAVTGPRPLSL